MRFSAQERSDLVLAWFGVSLAFTMATAGFGFGSTWLAVFMASAVSAGLGVVIHEVAHKYVANRMGLATQFVADKMMLVTGVVISLVGFIFLAPGGVRIWPAPDRRRSAIIAIAGPLSNVVLAAVFIGLSFSVPIARFGAIINAYLAIFNLIPFPGFDGRAVWNYNKAWSIVAIAVSAVLLLISFAL